MMYLDKRDRDRNRDLFPPWVVDWYVKAVKCFDREPVQPSTYVVWIDTGDTPDHRGHSFTLSWRDVFASSGEAVRATSDEAVRAALVAVIRLYPELSTADSPASGRREG